MQVLCISVCQMYKSIIGKKLLLSYELTALMANAAICFLFVVFFAYYIHKSQRCSTITIEPVSLLDVKIMIS